MNPTTKATIEFVIDKHKLRKDHDTAGNLIDALKKGGENTTSQHLTEAMASKDYLSRSTLINNFLRDIEPENEFIHVKPRQGIIVPKSPSSVVIPCNHYDGKSICNERASVLCITDSDPKFCFGICVKHQCGDLTKIPLAQVKALPWAREKELQDGSENMAQARVIDQTFCGRGMPFFCTACEGAFPIEQIETVRSPDNIYYVFCKSCFASVKPDPITYALEKNAIESEHEPCGVCDNPLDSDFHREHCEPDNPKPVRYVCSGCDKSFPEADCKPILVPAKFGNEIGDVTCYFCKPCFDSVKPNALEYAGKVVRGEV